jgi:Domain of Unknown Function (DUF1206).
MNSENAKQKVEETSRQVKPWVERLIRLGYGARGVVYIVIGTLTAQALIGTGGQTTGQRGALEEIVTQPSGQLLLGVIALGLTVYAAWRFVQALVDPDNEGTGAKGIIRRVGYAISGLTYTGLTFIAVQLLLGSGGGGDSNVKEHWTAQLMSQPFGKLLVLIIGIIIVGSGLSQFHQSYTAKFRKKLNLGMSNKEQTWAIRAGRLGYVARGIVFVIIGIFFIQASIQSDPGKAAGLEEALQALEHQPYDPWLLGVVAVGLFAYGIYSMVLARYGRISL